MMIKKCIIIANACENKKGGSAPIKDNNRRTILDFVLSFNLRKILLMIGAILKFFLELLI